MDNVTVRPGTRFLLSASIIFMLTIFPAFFSPNIAAEQGKAEMLSDLQQGIRAQNIGNFVSAVQHFRTVVQQLQADVDRNELATVYLHLAGSLQELGRFSEAIDVLSGALALAEESDDPALQTKAMTSLGQAYLLAGNGEAAVKYITGSAERTDSDADSALRAPVLNTLGSLYEGQKKYDDAGIVYGDVATLAKRSGNSGLAAKAKVNLARVSLQTGKTASAADALDEAINLADALPANHEKASVLIQVGRLFCDIHKSLSEEDAAGDVLTRAYNALTAAEKVANGIGDLRSSSYAMGYLGELYESEGRYSEALAYTRRAVFAAQKVQAPDILYLWQWQTARILEARNNIDGAISAFKRSLQNLDTIKKDLAEECHSNVRNRQSYYQTVGSIYFGLANLLLQRSAATQNQDLRRRDLLLARDTIERLKTVEIQDYFQDDCVASYLSQSLHLEALAVTTAIVYPIVLPNRVEILLSFKDDILQFTVQADGRELLREISSLRKKIEVPESDYLQHAQKLYDWLLRPIERELSRRRVSLLVFVLDSSLRSIPMSVLNDGERFLVQKYAVATTLGLTLTAPQPLGRENVRALLNGLTEGVQGFPPLPSVSEEMRYINTKFSGILLEDENFTKTKVEEALKQESYPIIHIASHGQFDSDPQKTFVLTFDDKLTMDELENLVSISRFREEPVELLTLSACQTAIGDDRAALGLAGVAVKAGARSALASLWFVDDEATAQLMVRFYENLSRFDGSKARALQQAQIALIENNKFQHPAFWAPFILIGNWL